VDKAASVVVGATGRRSDSSLCAGANADVNDLVQAGGSLMTITEFVLLILLSANGASLFSQMRRIQEIERKLNLVLTHFGIDPNVQVAPSTHVIGLAVDPKQRIAAIKAYREQTGAGLKEAVAVVDKIAASAKEADA
jgi:ribosomal protein L7/L12